MSSCSFPEGASDLSRVTQQVEEGLEIRASNCSFLSHFPSHVLNLNFSHPGLLPAHSTSLCSPLPRQFGSPTDLIPAGLRNTAALRCRTPQCVPGDQTLPVLSQDTVVTSEPCCPSFLSTPTCFFLVTVRANTSPYNALYAEKTAPLPSELDCQLLECCHNTLISFEQLTANC